MESLQKYFDLALETPDGIKKLRELILTLAMRGKLTEQDPNDQPASELLKEISAEKQRLIKEGKIKKQAEPAPISPDEIPYQVPKGWEWVRFSNCLDLRDGTHDTPKYTESGYPLITSKNLSLGYLNFDNIQYISEEDHLKIQIRSKVDKGDILFAMIGSIGNPVIVHTDIPFSIKNVALFKIISSINEKYLYYYLLLSQVKMKLIASGAVQSFVSLNFLRNYLFPLPPLAEQKRIVERIEILMAMCDKLEAEKKERDQKRIELHTSAMDGLLNSDGPEEFDKAWGFIIRNFEEIYSAKENVSELKKAILQLAVMGKLVPQDPNDRPASELLKEISAEKQRLIKEGKIKKQAELTPISPDEIPYQVPKGWEWVRLGEVSIFENGDRSNKYPDESDHRKSGIPFFGAKDMINGFLNYENDLRYISEEKFAELGNGKLIDQDFVFLLRGTVGKVATFLANEKYNTGFINAQMLIVRTYLNQINEYIKKYFFSYFFQFHIFNKTSGSAIRQMPANTLKSFIIPLPPLAEQKRIVEKIDILMKLADELETNINQAALKREELFSAVLAKI